MALTLPRPSRAVLLSGRRAWLGIGLAVALLLAGCGGHSAAPVREQQTVTAKAEAAAPPVAVMAPAFVLGEVQEPHNRIGRVRAAGIADAETVTIDPETPVIYVGSRSFATAKATYTNLVYRIHFLAQPYSLIPFHLGAGRHVGLLVILTLDARQQVLLVTTANTCGCYAASIPTATLPASAYPAGWQAAPLGVLGERLPARLPPIGANDVLQVFVRPDVHRVMDLRVVPRSSLAAGMVRAEVLDLEALKKIPMENGNVTSLYYRGWPLAGHVKGAIKPWETLLLSLVSLDLFVGMDKEYGDTRESGTPFYTSLKPWNRHASDMNDFVVYLRFNGWHL